MEKYRRSPLGAFDFSEGAAAGLLAGFVVYFFQGTSPVPSSLLQGCAGSRLQSGRRLQDVDDIRDWRRTGSRTYDEVAGSGCRIGRDVKGKAPRSAGSRREVVDGNAGAEVGPER